MKIYVLGPTGSGKSWIAKRLSERLGIPHIELDLLWIESGGLQHYGVRKKLPADVARRLVARGEKELARPSWVVDGNYRSTLQPRVIRQADIVVLMDLPRWRRLLNNITRHVTDHERREVFTTRNFLTAHIPRLLRKRGIALDRATVKAHPQYFIVRNRGEANLVLEEIHQWCLSKKL